MHQVTKSGAGIRVPRWLASAAGIALLATAQAQTIEYDVTLIPRAPDAYITLPSSINNDGVVVGTALYIGSDFFTRGWRWSEQDGLTLLPPPPGSMSDRYSANLINDNGVIGGDGGYDVGLAWRYEDGAYTILGTLSGLNGSWALGLNNSGDMVGGAFDAGSFLTPRRAYRYTDATGIQELFPEFSSSGASDINDARQIVASGGGRSFRLEPDGSQTVIPVPSGFSGLALSQINDLGDVAGVAVCSHECNQGFFYADELGGRVIPWLATRHSVTGLNNRREVVGRVTEGVARGWIWTEFDGVRALTSLIDPALSLKVYDAWGINDRGQIIASGDNITDPIDPRRIMLLTPVGSGIPGDIDGDGDVDLADLAALLASFGTCVGDPGFNPDADLDDSGCVDLADLATLLAEY